MIVYRILHYTVKQLHTGSGNDSRWCSEGRKVIYTASSIALACLENILRRSGSGFSADFRTIFYGIPDNINIKEIKITDLDIDWRSYISYNYCQQIGNAWYDAKDSFVLKVHSAIIPDEFNYVIKATVPAIDLVQVLENKIFLPDERLENIL